MDIVEAERPYTKEEEDQYFLRLCRGILDEITVILEMPGSPAYYTIQEVLRRRLKNNRA